jgi:ferric-dicitrate binding protein FerR (iron transport regulator)
MRTGATSRRADDDLSAEWRRLRRAALFFVACAVAFVALLWIGQLH